MPETNGRTLEQMNSVFKDGNGEREQIRRARIEQAISAEAVPSGPRKGSHSDVADVHV